MATDANAPPDWGEPAPRFTAPAPVNPAFGFDTLAGRFVALTFFGRAALPEARRFLDTLIAAALPRDDDRYAHFGVSSARADLDDAYCLSAFPPARIFHDPAFAIAEAYGLLAPETGASRPGFLGQWFLLDPTLRVIERGGLDRPEALIAALRALPPPERHAGLDGEGWAPVLLVPRVLEPAFCAELVEVYKTGRPKVSGFMRSDGGMTVGRLDPSFKRRADVLIEDAGIRERLREALVRRLVPEIARAFQFRATRIERYVVTCYDAREGGFFRPHRDNTTAGTAHRRFAVTLNLNAGEYDGGELRFPEYGGRRYRAPTGGAVVFSCSLLHEALPVTRGTRYATLPFLYDDTAAEQRETNLKYVAAEAAGALGEPT